MSGVFADTFYFLALVNPNDQSHARAVAMALAIQEKLVTTAWVLTKFADAMSAPVNRAVFTATLADLRSDPQVEIIPPDAALFELGLELYDGRPDKEWSLTDCISFVAMQKAGLKQALTGDRHFEQAGFIALLK